MTCMKDFEEYSEKRHFNKLFADDPNGTKVVKALQGQTPFLEMYEELDHIKNHVNGTWQHIRACVRGFGMGNGDGYDMEYLKSKEIVNELLAKHNWTMDEFLTELSGYPEFIKGYA